MKTSIRIELKGQLGAWIASGNYKIFSEQEINAELDRRAEINRNKNRH